MNHDPMNPLIYPRIHKHLHLAHHAQGRGKNCGVLHLSRIYESIHGFTSPQSTNPQIYESINPRHLRISQGPRIHRSTDLPIHESTNHDPTNPLVYPRIHKHLHLAHHAQGKGKSCGVLRLSRIYESIHGFTSPQSTKPQIYESIIPRHLRISHGSRIYRSTDLPIHESMNHDSTNPLIYSRIHKHLHLAHHAQGKGKKTLWGAASVMNPRIYLRIHKPSIHESTIYKSINPRVHKSMSKSSYLGVPPSPHCVLPTAFCTLYQGTRLAL